jgi:hypothetical protein
VSQANVETLRSFYEGLNTGEAPAEPVAAETVAAILVDRPLTEPAL